MSCNGKDMSRIYKGFLKAESWALGDRGRGRAIDENEDEGEFSRGSWYKKLDTSIQDVD